MRDRRFCRFMFALVLALGLLLVGCSCLQAPGGRLPAASGRSGGGAAPVTMGGLAFRSMPWQVKVAALPPGLEALALQGQLQAILDDANDVLSTWQPETEVMRFNRAPVGEWVAVSPLLLQAVRTAVAVSALSDGAYDITVGPLVELWGFGAQPVSGEPDASALAAARARVGWRQIGIDAAAGRLMRRADIRLDLSSIGEGLAVDALVAALEQRGMHDYLVGVAGTLQARGHRADGGPWTVAVEKPDGSGLPLRRLRLDGQAVSTSGAYRNFREVGGRRYSHTLDARTGRPITHRGLSVTVVVSAAEGGAAVHGAADGEAVSGIPGGAATQADALATAFNVLGPELGPELAKREGLALLYLEAEGVVEGTGPGLRFHEVGSPAFSSWVLR